MSLGSAQFLRCSQLIRCICCSLFRPYSAVDATTQCSSESNQCSYTFQYGDGSGTSGYCVYDAMYFDMILGNSMVENSSSAVVFGLDLQSIAVNGQLLAIDPTVFDASGTIVDTGTTLAYLVEEAYDPLKNAWSPQGTYLATIHRPGAAVWGGATTFNRLMRFAHSQVKLIDFSPGERFLVTYSSHEPSPS